MLEDRDAADTQLAYYIHGAAIDELLAMITPGGSHFYHRDGLGSTVRITNASGQVEEAYTYDVFGAATIRDGSGNALAASAVGNRFMFTGREWLKEVGLYDYRNRIYSQELGRFLQTDPIRFSAGDINIYRYVGNSAVNGRDPLGLCYPKTFIGPLQCGESYCNETGTDDGGTGGGRHGGGNSGGGSSWGGGTSPGGTGNGGTGGDSNNNGGGFWNWRTGQIVPYQPTTLTNEIGSVIALALNFVPIPGAEEAGIAVGAGDHIVLGLEAHGLEATAEQVGGRTLMNDVSWQTTLQSGSGDSGTRFTISLDGVSGTSSASQFMSAAQRGLATGSTPFNWEMGQLYQAGRHVDAAFIEGGQLLVNPFK